MSGGVVVAGRVISHAEAVEILRARGEQLPAVEREQLVAGDGQVELVAGNDQVELVAGDDQVELVAGDDHFERVADELLERLDELLERLQALSLLLAASPSARMAAAVKLKALLQR